MDFYNPTESYESYEGIRNHERQITITLTETHPVFTFPTPLPLPYVRKPDRFSNLSAEERWNYSKKIKDLQKLINEIQAGDLFQVSASGFTLEEVLEVLNVRRAMQKNYDR